MNILELNFERTWRGGERQTLYNMAGFRNAGHEVALLCRKGFSLATNAQSEGFKVIAYANIFQVFYYLAIHCRKYDVFHVQTSHILTWCLLSKPFHHARIIFTRRVDFVPHGRLTRIKYRLADKIIGISKAVQKIVTDFCGKEVIVISDVAVAKTLNRYRAELLIGELKVKPGTHIIGAVAALVPHKDPMNMVETIKQLYTKRKDFVFLHFGAGELEQNIKDKITEYGLGDVYKMMGFYEHVEDFFSIFEVFVMSSQEEGLGSSVLDAFLYKVPVVSTDAGGLQDLVKDGRGIVCGKKNPGQLAAGIDLLLSDPKSGKEMIDKAYVYVEQYHSLEFITRQYLDILAK